VKAAREDWERRLAESKEMPLATKLALGGGAATAVFAGTAALFAVRTAVVGADLDETTAAYEAALDEQRAEEASDLFAVQVDQIHTRRSAVGLTLGSVGLTAAGAGASITFWLKGRADRPRVEAWDFWNLDLPGAREVPPAAPDERPARPAEPAAPAPENDLEEEFGPMDQDVPDPEDFDFGDPEE
jgi:hypothetical protein